MLGRNPLNCRRLLANAQAFASDIDTEVASSQYQAIHELLSLDRVGGGSDRKVRSAG